MAQAIGLQAGTSRLQTGTFRAPRLDFNRIAAETGAIAINAVLLLLLLAPLSPQLAPVAPPDDIFIIPATPPKPPPPPEVVEVVDPRTPVPAPTHVRQQVEVPPVIFTDPTPIDIAVEPTPPVIAAATTQTSIGPAEPLAGAHLEYELAPPPTYPRDAMRDGLTGTVLLRVLVDVDGKPLEVSIERSSGHRSLDMAARRQVLARWKFRPAMQHDRAVQAIGLVPIDFTLDR